MKCPVLRQKEGAGTVLPRSNANTSIAGFRYMEKRRYIEKKV